MVVGALVAWLRVALTLVVPLFSRIELSSSDNVTVGAASSSSMVNVWSPGAATPCPPLAVAEMVTLLFSEYTESLLAATVTVPVLAVWPAAIVRVTSSLRSKSPATVLLPAAAETVRVTFSTDAWLRVAVTVVESPSETEVLDSASDTVGNESSSSMVMVLSVGSVTPRELTALPDTVTVLSGESTVLGMAVTVTVPVLVMAPAAMTSSLLLLSAKSRANAFKPGTADTVTVVLASDGRFKFAVIAVLPRFSEIVSSKSSIDKLTTGSGSSSSRVRPTLFTVTVSEFCDATELTAVPATVVVRFSSSRVLFTAVTVTESVLVVAPLAKVMVPGELTVK